MKSASSLRLFALSALTSLCTDAAHCQDVSKEDVDDMYGKSEAVAPEVQNGDISDISVIRPGARFHVTLDCSRCKCKVKKQLVDFDMFLGKSERDKDWEAKSVQEFVEHFNDVAIEKTLMMATSKTSEEDPKVDFDMVIMPTVVYLNGKIEAEVAIRKAATGEQVLKLNFSASGDDDDEIALRDPMKDGGEIVAKKLIRLLKL